MFRLYNLLPSLPFSHWDTDPLSTHVKPSYPGLPCATPSTPSLCHSPLPPIIFPVCFGFPIFPVILWVPVKRLWSYVLRVRQWLQQNPSVNMCSYFSIMVLDAHRSLTAPNNLVRHLMSCKWYYDFCKRVFCIVCYVSNFLPLKGGVCIDFTNSDDGRLFYSLLL